MVWFACLLFAYCIMQWIPRSLGIILVLGDSHSEQLGAQHDSQLTKEVSFHSQ